MLQRNVAKAKESETSRRSIIQPFQLPSTSPQYRKNKDSILGGNIKDRQLSITSPVTIFPVSESLPDGGMCNILIIFHAN